MKLYSIAQTLREIPIGRTMLYELIRRGELETAHVGRRVFVTGASMDAFIERSRDSDRDEKRDDLGGDADDAA